MRGDLSRSVKGKGATTLEMGRDLAFTSLFTAITSLIVVLALDLTWLVPDMEGKAGAYNPIRDFLSYQVDAASGQLMTGAFLMLAVSGWCYAAAAFLAPGANRVTLVATLLFGLGLFVGACFRAVPDAEKAVDHWMTSVARLHDIGIGGGFVPAMVAAFIDQRRIVFGRGPGFLLTKVSFWMIFGGAVATFLSTVFLKDVAGLMQRVFVIGIVLWLATEAHQLFWRTQEKEDLS